MKEIITSIFPEGKRRKTASCPPGNEWGEKRDLKRWKEKFAAAILCLMWGADITLLLSASSSVKLKSDTHIQLLCVCVCVCLCGLLCVACYFATWLRKGTVGRLYLHLKTAMNKTWHLTYCYVYMCVSLCASINTNEECASMLKQMPGVSKNIFQCNWQHDRSAETEANKTN